MSLGGTGQRHSKKSNGTSLLGSVRETNIIPVLVQNNTSSEAKRRRNKELRILLEEQKRSNKKKKSETKLSNNTQNTSNDDEENKEVGVPTSNSSPEESDTVVGGQQPQFPDVINTGVVLKRLEFLESELKRTQNMSKELHQRLLEKQSSTFLVSAKAAFDIIDEEGNVVEKSGSELKLVYPMKKISQKHS